MDDDQINKAIRGFKIERLCDSILGFNPHDAIIGEWVRWWLSDSIISEGKKRRIINPAIAISKCDRKRSIADILFVEELEPDSDYFEVLGVAEVENREKKLLEKLENLSFYEQIGKIEDERKFPDLQFALLCSKVNAEYVRGIAEFKNVELVNSIKTRMQNYSQKSSLYWVFYVLEYMKHEENYHLVVNEYEPGFLGFYYNRAFSGSEFFIYHKGKQVAHNSFLLDRRFPKRALKMGRERFEHGP